MEYSFPLGPTGVTKYQGRSYDYFNKIPVTWSAFGGGNNGNPDIFIPFSTDTVQFTNLTTDGYTQVAGGGALYNTAVIEYSLNGTTVHGELGSGYHNTFLEFKNRVVGLVWFRIQSGSGNATISVQAWGIR
jgi:hypothetical protein